MNAFEKIASRGILPFIVEGLGRRWATDGHRMLIEDDASIPSAGKDRVVRVRDHEEGDREAPPSALNMAGVVPDWYAPRTITLTDPKRLARSVKAMIKLQEEENESRVVEWKAQLDRKRARIKEAKGVYAKSVIRTTCDFVKPRPEKHGKFGLMPNATVFRSASNTMVETIGPPFSKLYAKELTTGEGQGVNLYFLLDALDALKGHGEVRVQMTVDQDPIMLGAGNLTAVIIPYRP